MTESRRPRFHPLLLTCLLSSGPPPLVLIKNTFTCDAWAKIKWTQSAENEGGNEERRRLVGSDEIRWDSDGTLVIKADVMAAQNTHDTTLSPCAELGAASLVSLLMLRVWSLLFRGQTGAWTTFRLKVCVQHLVPLDDQGLTELPESSMWTKWEGGRKSNLDLLSHRSSFLLCVFSKYQPRCHARKSQSLALTCPFQVQTYWARLFSNRQLTFGAWFVTSMVISPEIHNVGEEMCGSEAQVGKIKVPHYYALLQYRNSNEMVKHWITITNKVKTTANVCLGRCFTATMIPK